MTVTLRFDDPPSKPRKVLELGGELAGLTIWASSEGFQFESDDQSPMLEGESPIVARSAWLDWPGVWEALGRYRWVRYRLMHVDALIRDEVRQRAADRLALEAGHVRERWDDRWADLEERGE